MPEVPSQTKYRKELQVKAKAMTQITKGVVSPGWLTDVVKLLDPKARNGYRTRMKAMAFDLLGTHYKANDQ